MSRLRPLLVVPIILTVIAAGCGGSNPNAPASISGSVNYKGKPVTGGSVQFYTQSGTPYSAAIGADGTYSVADVPLGELIVCVETESVNPVHKASTGKEASQRQASMGNRQPPAGQGGGSGGTPSGEEPKYVKIPDKYAKSKTSPLTYTAKQGRQVHNIELE
jgi:hypothetical protein